MKTKFLLTLMFLTGSSVFVSAHLMAGGQPDKVAEKKKAEDIVVNSELFDQDLKDKVMTNCFCKTYTIKMEKDKSYQIELRSTSFRAYLRLENAAGQQLATDFDRFGNQSAVLVHRPTKTEDHNIIATSLNVNAKGKFTLIVKELTGNEGKPIDLKFTKGQASFQGNLARTDLKYSGKIHKLFTINLEKGSTYQIDQSSKNFDAYLYLIGPDGAVLDQNDDNGESLDSRIIHKANTTGQYRVVATSLGGSSTGDFSLTIRQTGGPAPRDEKKDAKDK